MFVVVSVFELHIPEGRSLKQKRKVVKSLVERIHARYRVSVAETDHHDLHQRAEIAVAAVHRSEPELSQLMDRIRDLVDGVPEAVLLSWDPQFLEAIG